MVVQMTLAGGEYGSEGELGRPRRPQGDGGGEGTTTHAFKVFTSDLRSPLQGGPPVWDGTLPYSLPEVEVDRGQGECAAGWNACREATTALRIAGLWPDGRPSRLFHVETTAEVVERGDKLGR